MHVPLVLILGAISCASWERVGLCAAGAPPSNCGLFGETAARRRRGRPTSRGEKTRSRGRGGIPELTIGARTDLTCLDAAVYGRFSRVR
jgi:hypothetical protein